MRRERVGRSKSDGVGVSPWGQTHAILPSRYALIAPHMRLSVQFSQSFTSLCRPLSWLTYPATFLDFDVWPRQKPETRKRKLTGIWNSEAVGRHGPHTVQHPCDKDRPLEDFIGSCPIYLCFGRGSVYYASLVLLFLFFFFFSSLFFPFSGFRLPFTFYFPRACRSPPSSETSSGTPSGTSKSMFLTNLHGYLHVLSFGLGERGSLLAISCRLCLTGGKRAETKTEILRFLRFLGDSIEGLCRSIGKVGES